MRTAARPWRRPPPARRAGWPSSLLRVSVGLGDLSVRQLTREVRRHICLYLDTRLAVCRVAKRATFAHTLHERAGRVRDDDLHALPFRRSELAEPSEQLFHAGAARSRDEQCGREFSGERLAERITLRALKTIALVEHELRLSVGELERREGVSNDLHALVKVRM